MDYGAVGKTNKEAPILEFSTWYIKSWHETKTFTAFLLQKMLLFNNLDELQKEYHLQQAIPRVPCNQYGDTSEFRHS